MLCFLFFLNTQLMVYDKSENSFQGLNRLAIAGRKQVTADTEAEIAHDDYPGRPAKASGFGRRTALHFLNQETAGGRQLEHLGRVAGHWNGDQAEPGPGDLAAGLVFLQHGLGTRDGHGETDADTALRPVNRRVDADHAAVRIEQRTAAIARIDGGVGLEIESND